MEQAQQAIAILGKADQLSKLAGSGAGVSEKIEQFYESVAHVKYGRKDPASRAITVGSQFALGTMAINAAQFLGAPLALFDKDLHDQWIAFNKQSWGLLITTMTSWWSPTLVRVSGDKSVRGQLRKTEDGALFCDFSERMVLMANHQIYTDWLYLWYIGYTNGMHGRIHVVLKESLKKIPVVGWGMTLSKFIFLKRNWEQDKIGLAKHLQSLNKPEDPMWLMFFPEGTNLAPSTREKSAAWAAKQGYKDYQHVLLPRTTGLHFVLLKLRETVDYVYDCTIAYEGVKRGEYAQDIYTIESSWLNGRPPASVNMHWRRFKISSIPLDDINAFDIWLRARWAEKDALMENYMRLGRFPADVGVDQTPEGETRHGAGYVETYVQPQNWYEILQVFAPIATFVLVLFYFYNITLPPNLLNTLQDWAGLSEDEIKQKLRIGPAPKLGKPKAITSQAFAKTLRPPSIRSDTASISNASVKTASTIKTLPKQSDWLMRSGPQMEPASTPTPKSTINRSVPKKPTATASSAKPLETKAPPTSKPAAEAVPTKNAAAKAKTPQTVAIKAPAPQKPQSKPTPTKKPLPKTLYPTQFPAKASTPKKPLPKTVLPSSSTPSTTAPSKKPSSKSSATKPPTAKPPTAKPAPETTTTKPTPSKPTLKKTPTPLPKTNLPPRRASTQAPSSTWSDTTAVETPWAERPSGKRAVKAQETRRDRVKMEKKTQRLHLEKVAG